MSKSQYDNIKPKLVSSSNPKQAKFQGRGGEFNGLCPNKPKLLDFGPSKK